MLKRLFQFLLIPGLISANAVVASAQPGLLIHRVLAKATGASSNKKELIELIATRAINFVTEPYTIIAANGGTATNGWVSGGSSSYAFGITTGSVTAGQNVYVGGSLAAVTGTCNKYLVDVTAVAGAGGVGAVSSTGVIPDGGSDASGIAVFNIAPASVTSSSIPVDGLFYGTAVGLAAQAKFTVPVNDMYFGGSLAWPDNRYLAPSPGTSYLAPATGSKFYASLNRWGYAESSLPVQQQSIALMPQLLP